MATLSCWAVYRQGDRGTNWYFILSGEVTMIVSSGHHYHKELVQHHQHHHVSTVREVELWPIRNGLPFH